MFTRRAVLISSASAVLIAQDPLISAVPSASAGTPGDVEIALYEDLVASSYSADFASEATSTIPSLVMFRLSKAARHVEIELHYDSRLFLARKRASVIRAGQVSSFECETVRSGASKSSVRVEFDGELSAGEEFTVLMPVMATPPRYPSDHFDQLAESSASIRVDDGIAHFFGTPSATPSPVSVWGAELAAGWEGLPVLQDGAAKLYQAPTLIRCLSVGPASTPSGLRIDIQYDARVIDKYQIVQWSVDETIEEIPLSVRMSAEQVPTMQIPLPKVLQAGQALTIELMPTTSLRSFPTNAVIAAASLISPSATGKRDTGRYTAADLTPSGDAASPSTAEMN